MGKILLILAVAVVVIFGLWLWRLWKQGRVK